MGELKQGLIHEPVAGERESGDDFCVLDGGDYFVVAVADGLGHGPDATVAARKAVRYVCEHPELPPGVLLERCHGLLQGTRGAVMAIVRVERSLGKLLHAGLGNIETRLVGKERVRRPVTVNGIVGHSARKFRVEEFPYAPGDMLIMHTDGISDRFEVGPASRDRDLQMLARQLAVENGKHHDDQLLLIVREEP